MRSPGWVAASAVMVVLVAACANAPSAAPSIVNGPPAAGASAASGNPSPSGPSATPVVAASPDRTPTPSATPAVGALGRILFARHSPVTDDVFCYRIQADGTGETPWGWCGPTSPDGRRILSDYAIPNGFGVFVGGRPVTTAPDGTDFRRLDAYPHDDISFWCTSWSPDGTRLLCESGADRIAADDGIYTLRASDGGDRRRISTAPRDHEDQPQGYSPDGSRILFARYADGSAGELWSVATDGSDAIRLSPAPLAVSDWSTPASWSPDGSRVAFAAAPTEGARRSLYVVDADGRNLREISPADVGGVTAQWSPDGS